MYNNQNLSLLTDLYQLTMMQGYYRYGKADKIAVFDLFFRANPFQAAFSVPAGLDQLIDYIENLQFTEEQIAYLAGLGLFDEDFLNYLRTFRFTGEIYAVPEGSVVFQIGRAHV